MSRHVSTGSIKNRPPAFSTKSFTRYEPSASSVSPTAGRNRASTIQSTSDTKSSTDKSQDVFDKKPTEEEDPLSPDLARSMSVPDRFDELPIELASLTDRFVDSLSAKVYNEPPTIEQLAELFQEFYLRAGSSISIHISALISRLNRDTSPAPARVARTKPAPSKKPKDSSASASETPAQAQQMLTATEVAEKRKARKLLEYKRVVLEEAVEKRACERVYDKIWRHKSTLDEVRDEKLRSKTAALALVGIGLKDLGIEIDAKAVKSLEDVQESLAPARESLARMNDEHYPLGKLQHLAAAHKAIVETLYTIHSSSSSADEVLPTLIYTLITSPVEGINIISNLNFVQNFRASTKIDGEAAYCLTNLEAAISFLENVDLTSLREDEVPEGPKRMASGRATPTVEKLDPFPEMTDSAISSSTTTTSVTPATASGTSVTPSITPALKPPPEKYAPLPSPRHQRTLSDILQPISSANVAVRNTAEEGFKNISNTLENSFKFLTGKLKERGNEDASVEVVVPKTLDEARELVNRPLTPEEDAVISETSSLAERDSDSTTPTSNLTKTEDKLLSLLGGRKPVAMTRERSMDSLRSNSSAKKVAFANTSSTTDTNTTSTTSSRPHPAQTQTSSNPLDTVKNFGNSINPINHIGSAFGGAFRSFGSRPSPSSPVAAVPPAPATQSLPRPAPPKAETDSAKDKSKEVPQVSLRIPPTVEIEKLTVIPPISRFMRTTDANELKIRDVQELLDDYQRLAKILGDLRLKVNEKEDGEAGASDDDDDDDDNKEDDEDDGTAGNGRNVKVASQTT